MGDNDKTDDVKTTKNKEVVAQTFGYEPFGDEWIKEMKKMTKMELIQMVKRVNESSACTLYVDYKESCQALKDMNKERGT